ncbi:MAG: M20/M25/M40 family metallo-hydrolase [Clostridia bacterium]|nr:M20/M25/M40 family metallo-hydrolase [Clostridia bacterium]
MTKTEIYASKLSEMIQHPTVSAKKQESAKHFSDFRQLLSRLFPKVFRVSELEDTDGSLLLHLKTESKAEPIMLMNHHDVVEASGSWRYPPFSGEITEGRIWGRGALDTKGGLFAMLQAAEELLEDGITPSRDVYFLSTCNEETSGEGAERISAILLERGLRFYMVLDEGGMIVSEPIAGAKGNYAMVGVGEKGCADLKFIARSDGGHASTPGKNTPLVRLGKFMAEVDKKTLFQSKLSPTVSAMLSTVSTGMRGILGTVLRHNRLLSPLLTIAIPSVSPTAAAMLRTTVAFTMAGGSDGTNVLPHEAWVIGNMRYSHHEGGEASIAAITKLAKKHGIEVEVLDRGFDSPISDHRSEAFALINRAIQSSFPDVTTSPYIMTGASDCRFMSRISDNCLRFTPFTVESKQLDSIHGTNENLSLSCLVPAVNFYKFIITEA